MTRNFTENERHAIANALSSAAIRWGEAADNLMRPEPANTFRRQADEASAFAALILNASRLTVVAN